MSEVSLELAPKYIIDKWLFTAKKNLRPEEKWVKFLRIWISIKQCNENKNNITTVASHKRFPMAMHTTVIRQYGKGLFGKKPNAEKSFQRSVLTVMCPHGKVSLR